MEEYDLIVIGGGFAGLCSAGLYLKATPGSKILILESHSLPGGQASYFRRAGIYFDVGATTLSGLREGMPLNILHSLLDFKYSFKKENGINVIIEDQTINWPISQKNDFFSSSQVHLIQKLRVLAKDLWSYALSAEGLFFPRIKDLKRLPKPAIKLPMYLRSTKSFLHLSDRSAAKKIIDELLLISTQSYSQEVPAILASLALDYADDIWRPNGGIGRYLFSLSKHLESQGIEIKYKIKVLKVVNDKGVVVEDENGLKYKSKELVITLPVWNAVNLFSKESVEYTNLKRYSEKFETSTWSAFTFYGIFESAIKDLPTYWQLHIKSDHSLIDSGSIFFTVDKQQGSLYSFTASTHINAAKFWSFIEGKDYPFFKKELEEWFLKIMEQNSTFKLLSDSLKILEIGTPKTFARYTQHTLGRVGGIAHTFSNYRKGLPIFPWTKTAPIYFIGDSYFPGQGLVTIAIRSLNWFRYLRR